MLTTERLERGYQTAARALLGEAVPAGHWEGELSSSPLSTATAIAAFQSMINQQPHRSDEFRSLIDGGVDWLAKHQNPDGGWGDTVLSHSNISTSMLAYASFHMTGAATSHPQVVERATAHVEAQGGFDAIRARYGKDHTFSVPILTQCALAGLLPWNKISPLPFELGWLPHRFFQWIRLPVVSYALPALIAIGQARHFHAPSWNPLIRWIRRAAVKPTLRRLTSIQPESGGFLEATPLTSFVTMSLVSMGLTDHPVAKQGLSFLVNSVRPDGSWPIDTNLATWATTLSINALAGEELDDSMVDALITWLLSQQHRKVHRYTNAAPGGWAWTNLSGGVPDADDTPGAILALLKLRPDCERVREAASAGIGWLLDLQNSDGGWPTFCRGWGALPFDRSTPDLTAHTLRAIRAWQPSPKPGSRIERAVTAGFGFLARTQRSDGAWLPLWFGNQFATDEENPTYGVSKGLAAYRDWDRLSDEVPQRAIQWLVSAQNQDGGWGGNLQTPSSVEETALAVEALLSVPFADKACQRGVSWLLDRVSEDSFRQPAPIGLYFAKLWYFERLYPMIFTVAALARAVENAARLVDSSPVDSNRPADVRPAMTS
ncbi:MAG: squalene--hopene cyclase [Planctomycetes bacterium]|nr:squalene--hopene cyclase [Planctomycetota bacterium]